MFQRSNSRVFKNKGIRRPEVTWQTGRNSQLVADCARIPTVCFSAKRTNQLTLNQETSKVVYLKQINLKKNINSETHYKGNRATRTDNCAKLKHTTQ